MGEPTLLVLPLDGESATLALGRALGGLLGPGAVLLLEGGLGAGKTTLCRGLALGLGVDAAYVIASPTFTLLNVYPGRLDFFHADLYRLGPGEADELELLEQAVQGVLAVEWPERAPGLWPSTALRLTLEPLGDFGRRALVAGPDPLLAALVGAMNPQR